MTKTKKKVKRKKSSKIKVHLKPIKTKPGRWCSIYTGRLPYPIECQTNKQTPITYTFKSGKQTLIYDRTACKKCTRQIEFIPWKNGEWNKIKEAIDQGNDLRDMDLSFINKK